MQRFTRFRQVLVMAGVASLMLATSVSAEPVQRRVSTTPRTRSSYPRRTREDLAGRDGRYLRAGRIYEQRRHDGLRR